MARSRRAFTLIELLVVIAIVCILAALLFGGFGLARERALATSEISQLHQIGLASALYSEQGGAQALAFEDLRLAGMIREDMAASPRDPTNEGIANYWLENQLIPNSWGLTRVVPYRLSYLGFYDDNFRRSDYAKLVEHGQNVGWLISLIDAQFVGHDPMSLSSGFGLRLLNDTSVRRFPIGCQIYHGDKHFAHAALFGDFDLDWLFGTYLGES